MRAGALDKVVYEAAASGLPVLVASEGFEPLVARHRAVAPVRAGRRGGARRPHLRALLEAGPERRRAIGGELRARVVRDHSVEHWAERVRRGRAMTHGAARAEGVRRLGLGGAPPLAAAAAARARAGMRGCSCCTRVSRARASSSSGCGAAAFPTEAWRMRFDLDPTVPRAGSRAGGRTILHTHLVHADVLALPAAALGARAGPRLSTKHGFNEFRANRIVGGADRAAARFAHRADRDLARPRSLPRGDRGVRRRRFHRRALRHRSRGRSRHRRPAPTEARRRRAG